MALYSAEIVFRDGTGRSFEYVTLKYWGAGPDFVSFMDERGGALTVNLDAVQTMQTWTPASSIAQDKP